LAPSAALAANTNYTASVLGGSTGAQDQYGNAMLSTYSWSFMTDGPAPVVSSTSPAAGATGASTAAGILVAFSHAMAATTITTSTILLKDPSGNVVPSTIAYDPSTYTATLTPNNFLPTATTYTATVLGGSTGSVVKDLNGYSLASTYSWSFTTSA